MSNTDTDETSGSERRDFFRVNDEILFRYQTIDADMAENADPLNVFPDEKGAALIGELAKVDQTMQGLLKTVGDHNRELGSYLQKLNQKVDIIARSVMFNQSSTDNSTYPINLSEGGVAFPCERMLYKGNHLVMRLIFLPSMVPVILFGEVIRCEHDGDTYQVAVGFRRVKEAERQELSRQIMRAQIKHKNTEPSDK